MNTTSSPPDRAVVVFDGECGFCRFWISRWRARSGGRIDFAPYQEAAARFPEIPVEAFARAVHLIEPDGRVSSGAEAVGRARAIGFDRTAMLSLYRGAPGAAAVMEAAYRLVAAHRNAAGRFTRLLWGVPDAPAYRRASAIFLRFLGLIYAIAFASLAVQIRGLVGSRGILPVGGFLSWIAAQTGLSRFWVAPTLCWISPSDNFLVFLCCGGFAAAVLALLDFAPAAALAVCWGFYLSLSVAGQDFLAFQWDVLLIEAGFLAIFLAPRRFRRSSGSDPPPPPLVHGLLLWLLFRLMFSSGAVKLASGDPTWRRLTALDYHYWTQPLPTPLAWWAAKLPETVQRSSTLLVLVIELMCPFLLVLPRRARHLAAAIFIALQIAIAATGNYAFFNLLAAALCVLALDDALLGRFRLRRGRGSRTAAGTPGRRWPTAILAPVAAIVVLASIGEMIRLAPARLPGAAPFLLADRLVAPLRIVNGYGLFAVMTTSRPEIVVEGSRDGRSWRPYAFRWKPGDPGSAPAYVAPYQPRLDWQMWFAALGGARDNPWFFEFLRRLLEGSRPVEKLLASNTFPREPPRWVRARLYEYRFSTVEERRRTGDWWTRTPEGLYFPPISRDELPGPP